MEETGKHQAVKLRIEELEAEVRLLRESNEALRKELQERIEAEKAVRDRIPLELEQDAGFETFLSEVSIHFAGISAKKVEREIEDVIRRVAVRFGFDRGSFAEYSNDLQQIYATESWAREGLLGYSSLSEDELFITKKYFPWISERMFQGHIVTFSALEDLPKEAEVDRKTFHELGVKSGISIPYFVEGCFMFAFTFASNNSGWVWSEGMIHRFRRLGEIFLNAILRKKADQEMQRAFSEIRELKDRLQQENLLLRRKIGSIGKQFKIIGESDPIKKVLAKVEQVARTHTTVLILGETGTGKELIARAIHNLSERRNHPMVAVSCASLPSTLVEAELFGREKGAYTGAISKQIGRFELACDSTIFLDEIGELPMELQAKLLRVLEEGSFERLGSPKTVIVDARVIAATNRDLLKEVQEGKFREDLYYRLNVFPIRIPPLRERPEDILPLTRAFVKDFSESMGKRIDSIEEASLDALQNYNWPGNVRELKNMIERAMISSSGGTLALELPETRPGVKGNHVTLEEMERAYILSVLEKTKWRIKGEYGAAEVLGLNPGTLYSKMRKLGLDVSQRSARRIGNFKLY